MSSSFQQSSSGNKIGSRKVKFGNNIKTSGFQSKGGIGSSRGGNRSSGGSKIKPKAGYSSKNFSIDVAAGPLKEEVKSSMEIVSQSSPRGKAILQSVFSPMKTDYVYKYEPGVMSLRIKGRVI